MTKTITSSPLRPRMIEHMVARHLEHREAFRSLAQGRPDSAERFLLAEFVSDGHDERF